MTIGPTEEQFGASPRSKTLRLLALAQREHTSTRYPSELAERIQVNTTCCGTDWTCAILRGPRASVADPSRGTCSPDSVTRRFGIDWAYRSAGTA
jgi:hypothetical protein